MQALKMSFKFSQLVFFLCILVAILGFGLREVLAHDVQARLDRILVEEQNDTESALTIRTERVDPLDDLKKYRGGYNITNKHYWSSTIFTGKFGYIIAALWIISGLIYAVILLAATLCCSKKRRTQARRVPCTRKHSLWPAIVGLLFTILALVASGVALGGSTRVNSRAITIKNIIVGAATNASGTIHTVTESIQAMQSDPQIYAGLHGSSRLNSTLQRLNKEVDNVERKATRTMGKLNTGLKILNVVTIVTVSVNLFAILALLVSGPILRLRGIFRTLIILCWVLTFLFWVYFGLYYFLNKFSGDTCAALGEFQLDPRNSTLSSILPCNDQRSAKRALRAVGAGIYNVANKVNANISSLGSSLPGIKYICNPFSGPPDYSYQPENCSSDTIQIGNIPQAIKMYACSNETCNGGEFIPATVYNSVSLYTSSVQNILDAYPGMESLVDCRLVKDAFSKILTEECKPLKKYVHMTWAAFATLSTLMVILLLIWTVQGRRKSRCCSLDGSVKPHFTPETTESSDAEETEMTYKNLEHGKNFGLLDRHK